MTHVTEVFCITEQVYEEVARALVGLPGESLVDVGGTGMLQPYLPEPWQVTDANIRDGVDGCNLPHEDQAFDMGVSMVTLEHVPARQRHAFMDELIRVSRHGVLLCYPIHFLEVDRLKRTVFDHEHPTHEDIAPEPIEAYLRSRGLQVSSYPFSSRLIHLLGICAWTRREEQPDLYRFFKEEFEKEKPDRSNAYLMMTVARFEPTAERPTKERPNGD